MPLITPLFTGLGSEGPILQERKIMKQIIAIFFLAAFSPLGNVNAQAADDGVLSLVVRVVKEQVAVQDLLKPDHPLWQDAGGNLIHLNRTPPLYSNEAQDDGQRPSASVRVLRMPDNTGIIFLQWEDESENHFGTGKKYPDGGDEHIYKTQTVSTDRFGDAACVMVPRQRGEHKKYPLIMMGEKEAPVDLALWQAERGFALLSAHGRETTENPQWQQQGFSSYQNGVWSVIQVVPDLQPKTPICFAIWDGQKEHHGGIKYYSLWYEVN
jgi:hypothetical protein